MKKMIVFGVALIAAAAVLAMSKAPADSCGSSKECAMKEAGSCCSTDGSCQAGDGSCSMEKKTCGGSCEGSCGCEGKKAGQCDGPCAGESKAPCEGSTCEPGAKAEPKGCCGSCGGK